MRCRLWNDNKYPLEEMFKGDLIKIPAGGSIEMDLFEANEFRGQYHPQPVDNQGKLLGDPKYFKIVRIERLDGEKAAPKIESHVCMQCKHSSPSPEELAAHIKVRHADAQRLELPAEDEAIAAKKRGPGRPPKEAA